MVEFVDIAGLVEGAHRGEGLGNRFLAHIREVQALVHVVRCFEEPNVAHPAGAIDPVRDVEIVETELLLADLETVEKRQERVGRAARSGEPEAQREEAFLQRLEGELGVGRPARQLEPDPAEERILDSLFLLTRKPVLYVANLPEDSLDGGNAYSHALVQARGEAHVLALSCELESELQDLEPSERQEYLEAVGFDEPGVHRLIRATYETLGLITFFTFNEKEVRAWTIRQGTLAVQAAGVVHSDFEEGFIRAETVSYSDFERAGSLKAAREDGSVRAEGREHRVEDGDILLFRAQS